MKILHVSTSFPSNNTDMSGNFVLRLIEAELKLGLECQVLTPASAVPSSWPEALKVCRFPYAPRALQVLFNQPGGALSSLKKRPSLYVLVLPFLTSMAWNLVRHARHCDIIHANWSLCGALAVLTRHIHRKPVITTIHGSDHYLCDKNPFYKWVHFVAVTKSTLVACVSMAITNDLKRKLPFCCQRISFIPNGVSESFFSVPIRKRSNTDLKFLYVGSLISIKGVDILLRSLGRLGQEKAWTLSVAGTGPDHEKLSLLVGQEGIMSKVSFLGPVDPMAMPALMSSHDVLVLPSYREGRPSVVLEALAAGLPVIATDIDGTRELVEDGVTGWLFKPGDINALRAILLKILDGAYDLDQMGRQARKWMNSNGLTWDETAKKYKKLYMEATNGA